MNIKIGVTSSEKNKINKNVNLTHNITGNLTEDCDVVNPSILVNYNAAYLKCNYAYIEAFGRYYYIGDMIIVDKMIRINLHCDVLYSFKSDILSSQAHILRSAQGNNYIVDNFATQTNRTAVLYRQLTTAFAPGKTNVLILSD